MTNTLPVFQSLMNSRPKWSQASPSAPPKPSATFSTLLVVQPQAVQVAGAEVGDEEMIPTVEGQPVRRVQPGDRLRVRDE